MHSQITRIRNKDGSESLKRRSDGLTLAYSAPNLTTILTGVTDPLFVLKRIETRLSLPLLTLILCGTS
jgi:hypothetical protein